MAEADVWSEVKMQHTFNHCIIAQNCWKEIALLFTRKWTDPISLS
jgi:hypothetical protein